MSKITIPDNSILLLEGGSLRGLFTAGVLFGFISARINWGTILSGDPKEFISLVVWGT